MDSATSGQDDLLVQIRDEKDADELEKLLLDPQEDHRVRLLAARALGRMGQKKSIQALIKALDDKYPSVRHEAIAALGMIGDGNACSELMRLLWGESGYVKGIAARSLIQIYGIPLPEKKNIGLLSELLWSGDVRIKDALLQAGPPGLAALSKMLDSESFSTRSQAAQTLALRVRRMADELPPGRFIFPWLEDQGVFVRSICRLYSFRTSCQGEAVAKVENSGFDSVSMTICGERMLQLSTAALSLSSGLDDEIIEAVHLEDLLSRHGARQLRRMGRTLVATAGGGHLAIKLCVKEGDESRLLYEAKMQRHLRNLGLCSSIPEPQGGLFCIDGLSWMEDELGLGPERSRVNGICYTAGPNYFRYLSDPLLSDNEMMGGLMSCAHDLGRLTRVGLIHRSLIPLFHNRERTCGGNCNYRWNRKLAGRLDNWMESCRFPNLRLSGIADLEHMEAHSQVSSQALQAYAGEHLFSMSLVLGCYFCRRGTSGQTAMGLALEECFKRYYRSLTGGDPDPLDAGIDWDDLGSRMAEEMGERKSNGKAFAPGEPHLGLRNGPFPIPELLRAVHIASTFAVMELQSRARGKSPDRSRVNRAN